MVRCSPREDISSSKMDNAVLSFVRKVVVCAGRFAAVVTADVLDFFAVDMVTQDIY